MAKQLAFHVDLSACTGCKACQIACKDKNDLPVGQNFRRVYEVAGGDWVQRGQAWVSNVYAYHVSISCMHCSQPICQEVCPAGAFTKRDDGVVILDRNQCIGCRYCEWSCPYGGPQFDQKTGTMAKCDFCADYLAEGKNPACVDACPLRALDFGELDALQAKYGGVTDVYPLPEAGLTNPCTIFTPHKDSVRARTEHAHIGNNEEV